MVLKSFFIYNPCSCCLDQSQMKLSHIKFSNISFFLLRNLARIITIITVLFIFLGVMGHTIRDRTVELAVLMYIPLLPLGLWAVLWDLFRAGRSLPLFRFGLTVIGLCIMIWGGVSMIGMGGSQMSLEPDEQVSILHWNVYWGGRGKNGWKSIRHDIEQRHPDIAILSEPPAEDRLILLLQQMGWQMIMYEKTRKNPLAICSSWPLQLERFVRFRNGRGMIVVVTVRGKPLRVLAVDGKRNMSNRLVVLSREVLPRLRTPFLTSVVETIEANEKMGQAIDIIAGDFNALSLSRGFDAFAQVGGGYHLASKFSRDWRGTWKSYLPLYDIDHVWVHKHFQGLRTELLTNLKSDHRGQLVQFKVWNPKF
jgi:endonuclease/exonuclease/phosphatase (EEP) superfamily protein YafD